MDAGGNDRGKRGRKVVVMLSDEEVAEIDDYWHRRRLASRGEAMRELMRKGFEREAST